MDGQPKRARMRASFESMEPSRDEATYSGRPERARAWATLESICGKRRGSLSKDIAFG